MNSNDTLSIEKYQINIYSSAIAGNDFNQTNQVGPIGLSIRTSLFHIFLQHSSEERSAGFDVQ